MIMRICGANKDKHCKRMRKSNTETDTVKCITEKYLYNICMYYIKILEFYSFFFNSIILFLKE